MMHAIRGQGREGGRNDVFVPITASFPGRSDQPSIMTMRGHTLAHCTYVRRKEPDVHDTACVRTSMGERAETHEEVHVVALQYISIIHLPPPEHNATGPPTATNRISTIWRDAVTITTYT